MELAVVDLPKLKEEFNKISRENGHEEKKEPKPMPKNKLELIAEAEELAKAKGIALKARTGLMKMRKDELKDLIAKIQDAKPEPEEPEEPGGSDSSDSTEVIQRIREYVKKINEALNEL